MNPSEYGTEKDRMLEILDKREEFNHKKLVDKPSLVLDWKVRNRVICVGFEVILNREIHNNPAGLKIGGLCIRSSYSMLYWSHTGSDWDINLNRAIQKCGISP